METIQESLDIINDYTSTLLHHRMSEKEKQFIYSVTKLQEAYRNSGKIQVEVVQATQKAIAFIGETKAKWEGRELEAETERAKLEAKHPRGGGKKDKDLIYRSLYLGAAALLQLTELQVILETGLTTKELYRQLIGATESKPESPQLITPKALAAAGWDEEYPNGYLKSFSDGDAIRVEFSDKNNRLAIHQLKVQVLAGGQESCNLAHIKTMAQLDSLYRVLTGEGH